MLITFYIKKKELYKIFNYISNKCILHLNTTMYSTKHMKFINSNKRIIFFFGLQKIRYEFR